MKLNEFGVGRITAQNTTKDVKPGETERQAKKLGLGGKPKLLHKTAAKNSDPNTLMNLGIGESEVQELRIEKPDPKDTLGIERKFMPQIKSDDYEEFIEFLTQNGVKFKQETIPASDLRAMQKQFSDKGILKQLEKNIAQGPNTKAVIASSDDYILDGHHRWLVAVNTGTDLNVYRVNMPAWRLYDLVNQFQKVYYKDIYDEGKPTVGVPLSSGLVVSIFPHRPLRIKKSTPGKLRYDESFNIGISDTVLYEEWSKKYKDSINCSNPKGFSQKAHCAGKKKKSESINEESGKEMFAYFQKMHRHEPDNNSDMKQFILSHDWELRDFTPDMYPIEEEFFDYDDPFNRVIDVDYSHRVDLSQPIIVGPQYSDGKYSVIDGNHRAASAQRMDKTIKGYFPIKQVTEDDSLGSQINFPGFEKKEKPKPKYNPIPKKDKSVLDKIKGFFTGENINEAYLLQLERGKDDLVLHVKDTKTGERMEVRGKPGYETSYDADDELHQLLDIIGKASNISELMNGEVVNVNPKHPDGPRSYSALDNLMNEAIEPQFDVEWDEAARYPEFVAIGKKAWIELASKGRAVTITDASDINNTDAADPNSFKNLDKNKQARALAQIEKGSVEMPIVAVYSDGYKELIGGNTRLTAMMAKDGRATVWQFEVPDEVALLAEAQVDEGVNDPHIFKAVFLAGGPGSGKSFVAQAILGGTGLRSVNSDEIYEFLMKKQGLSLDPATIFSPQGQEIRDRAKQLTMKREANYLDGRIGLVIDGTGKDVSKYEKMAQKLKVIGYDVSMIYVNTSLEVAQQRNKQRERSLEPAKVEQMWNEVQQNLMKFQQIFGAGRFHIIDNSGGLEDLDRQKNFDKVYNETQRFLNTPPSKRAALAWIKQQKEQNDEKRSATQQQNRQPHGGTSATN